MELATVKNYAAWAKDLATHLYREHALELWSRSEPEGMLPTGRKRSGLPRAREPARPRAARCGRRETARQVRRQIGHAQRQSPAHRERVAREKSEFQTQGVETAVSIGTSILRAVFGRKWLSAGTARSAGTAARGASRTAKQHGDIARAEKALQRALDDRAKFEEQYISEETKINEQFRDPAIEPYALGPRKRDIDVTRVSLAWVR